MDSEVKYLLSPRAIRDSVKIVGIVADEADQVISFYTATSYGHRTMTSSISSLAENGASYIDPFDFSVYMDQVRLNFNSYHALLVY